MSEPILTVNHLSFGFRDQQLYQDLSFQLNVGSMTSLVGPNGVGKTTLIRLLMAQLKPQAGTIRFRQQPPVRLGYVPQFRNVDTEFPCRSAVSFNSGSWIISFSGIRVRRRLPWMP